MSDLTLVSRLRFVSTTHAAEKGYSDASDQKAYSAAWIRIVNQEMARPATSHVAGRCHLFPQRPRVDMAPPIDPRPTHAANGQRVVPQPAGALVRGSTKRAINNNILGSSRA